MNGNSDNFGSSNSGAEMRTPEHALWDESIGENPPIMRRRRFRNRLGVGNLPFFYPFGSPYEEQSDQTILPPNPTININQEQNAWNPVGVMNPFPRRRNLPFFTIPTILNSFSNGNNRFFRYPNNDRIDIRELLMLNNDRPNSSFKTPQEKEDFELAQKLQMEEYGYPNGSNPSSSSAFDSFSEPARMKRRKRRKRNFERLEQRNNRRHMFNSCFIDRKHLLEKRRYFKYKNLRIRELNRNRKINRFSDRIMLSKLKKLQPSTSLPPNISVDDLLSGCYYKEGKINEIKRIKEEEEEEEGESERGEEILEICFLIDCTGSMSKILDILRDYLEGIVAQLLIDVPGIRFSFVVFGDYSDYKIYYLLKKLDFTNDPSIVQNFLKEVTGTGGGHHEEEAYNLAFMEAKNLNWSSNSQKFVILIGDSYPYRREQSPLGLDWRDIVNQQRRIPLLNGKEARIISIQCIRSNPMIDSFYGSVSEHNIRIDSFNIGKIFEIFLSICYNKKKNDELDDLLEKFSGLSIDPGNVRKFHSKLN